MPAQFDGAAAIVLSANENPAHGVTYGLSELSGILDKVARIFVQHRCHGVGTNELIGRREGHRCAPALEVALRALPVSLSRITSLTDAGASSRADHGDWRQCVVNGQL